MVAMRRERNRDSERPRATNTTARPRLFREDWNHPASRSVRATMTESARRRTSAADDGVLSFFALACGTTWALDLPLALAWATNAAPPPYAMPMVALGALGPSLAALLVAGRRGELRDVFRRWRTKPIWIVLGLMLPMATQLPATVIEVALGGHP